MNMNKHPILFDFETSPIKYFDRFIMELGKALNLSHNTMATAAVYYHRFYMFHTFQDFAKFVSFGLFVFQSLRQWLSVNLTYNMSFCQSVSSSII